MADKTERELLEMLQEPTTDGVKRDQIKADILMRDFGRAIAPIINAHLARVAQSIKDKKG